MSSRGSMRPSSPTIRQKSSCPGSRSTGAGRAPGPSSGTKSLPYMRPAYQPFVTDEPRMRGANVTFGRCDNEWVSEHRDGPSADVSVRVGWADDAPGIGAVQARAWRQEYAGLLPSEVLDTFDAEQFAGAWRRSLQAARDARQRVLVALERNTVRGFAVTGPASDPDLDPVADGDVSELVVDPSYSRQGHGSRLVQACVDTLR